VVPARTAIRERRLAAVWTNPDDAAPHVTRGGAFARCRHARRRDAGAQAEAEFCTSVLEDAVRVEQLGVFSRFETGAGRAGSRDAGDAVGLVPRLGSGRRDDSGPARPLILPRPLFRPVRPSSEVSAIRFSCASAPVVVPPSGGPARCARSDYVFGR